MRAVIQRVQKASVEVDEQVVGQIGHGLLILLGIETSDTEEDITWLSRKITKMRIFNDEQGLMNLSLEQVHGSLLLISQFTLYASTVKGNRPSYIQAARPEVAIPLYEVMIKQLEQDSGTKVETGMFGADMKVALINDGPVTIWMDIKNRQ